ncbi:MAG: TM2 domain-containing protein [Dysosmobacter sp.]
MNPWAKFFVTLFFGMFGIHKFAERKIGPGLAYLFTAGLFGVGWLYDTVCSLAAALQSSGHSSAPAANKGATVQSAAPAVQAPLKPNAYRQQQGKESLSPRASASILRPAGRP